MLTISVRDTKSGLAKVVIEKKKSKDEQGDITTETVKEYTYNGTRKQQKIEIKLSVPYQEYLRGYKVVATDKENNEKTVDENDKKIKCENYIITTAEELQNLATEVNNNGNNYQGVTIELGNDIDLSNIENFTPIGTSSKQFKGSFNGNGYTISNLQIERNENRTGLFGNVGTGASIENVRIKNCNITGNGQFVGGLIGFNAGGTVNKIAVSGKIDNGYNSSSADIGGIIGYIDSGTIKNSYSKVEITSTGGNIGGLVGQLTSKGSIENCYSIGKVTGGTSNVGGLVGTSGTITNSYWTKETSGVEKSNNGTSVLLSALTHEALYQGTSWDFENVWKIEEGKTTPYLKGMGEQEEIKTALEGHEIMSGIGTESNPYKITNGKQLNLINFELGVYYELENDIDLSKIPNFTPIGTSSNQFKGSFNGNGYTISNLQIERNEDRTGLFGNVGTGANIENVKIKDCNIIGNGQFVGGLIGFNAGGTVNKIAVSGKIDNGSNNSYADVGGVIGYIDSGTIKNSYSKVEITSTGGNIGGLVGQLTSKGSIENCYSIGKVTGGMSNVGGLVGTSGTITNSYWDTDTSGITKGSYGTGKTTAEMKKQETYVEWDFDTIWEWVENDYPKLKPNSN